MKKLKKIICSLLVVVMCLTSAPLQGFVGLEWPDLSALFTTKTSAASEGYYYYTVSDGKATITGCDKSISGDIVIPDTLGGYPVTSIGGYAFSWCSSLTSITIPDSVTSIGYDAFYNCTSLTSITIPDSVTSIGDFAFRDCRSLTSITIPDSVTSIGDNAFKYCESLTSITIPDSVTSIGEEAFYNTAWYNALPDGDVYAGKVYYKYKGTMPENTSIVIKDGTKSFADGALKNCTGLTSITIPDSVTSIGYDAFYNCTSLTSITVDSANEYYSSDGYGVLFNKDKTTLIQYPVGKNNTKYSIPDSVTSIGECAFSDCTSLTSITIPDSVTSIGGSAFYYCTSLTNITIPDSVTSIGSSAFYYCTSLTNITIPDSVTYIGFRVFYGCTRLTSITIPDSVTSIGDRAFEDCTGLTSITIPDSVTSIGYGAFYNCASLTSITIPNSVTSIGSEAFYNCHSLTSITIPNSVTSIGYGVFEYCESLTSITIPDSVTSIGEGAFSNCTSLTSITIPDSVTSIGDYAFYDCKSIKDVYYSGTEAQWNAISIGDYNACLNNATIHFNYCAHANKQYVTTQYPTCTEAGEMKMQCQDCKAYLDDVQVLPALGHTYGEWEEIDETYHYHSCTVCGDIEGVEHSWSEWEEIPATCTEDGEKSRTCSVCESTDIEVLSATDHAWGEWFTVTPATCTTAGLEKRVCANDETHVETRVIPATGHTAETIIGTPATCESNGLSDGEKCAVCGEILVAPTVFPALGHSYGEWEEIDETYHYHSCTVCGDIEGVEHSWSEWEEIPATCTEDGEKSRTCSVCESTDIEVLSATDHAWGEWFTVTPATCTTAGLEKRVCANDETHVETRVIPATGHTAETIIGTPATCESNGLSDGEKCAACGEILVAQTALPALGHSYGEWCAVTPATCTATGLEKRVCANDITHVETRDIPATGHDFNGSTCTVCGFDRSETCSCNCHKGGLAGFFFRLINFFQKLFGQNKVCACGASH